MEGKVIALGTWTFVFPGLILILRGHQNQFSISPLIRTFFQWHEVVEVNELVN
jgi:hypothetical protein